MIRIERVKAPCEICEDRAHNSMDYFFVPESPKECFRVTTTDGTPVTLCLAHVARVYCGPTLPRLQRCAGCGDRAKCAEFTRHDRDKHGVMFCLARCLGALRRMTVDSMTRLVAEGDATEWDPHYAPPPWAKYSESALAEQQRRAR